MSGLVFYLFIHIGGKCKQIKSNRNLQENEVIQCYRFLYPQFMGEGQEQGLMYLCGIEITSKKSFKVSPE